MDETDLQIIKELRQDGQVSFLTIAKKANLSPETVRQRYKNMVKSGDIKLNYIVLDLEKFGYQTSVFLFIKGKPNCSRKETVDHLKKIPNIVTISEVTGNFDFYASGLAHDLEDFYELIENINKIPLITHVEFTLTKELSLVHSQKIGNKKIPKFWGVR